MAKDKRVLSDEERKAKRAAWQREWRKKHPGYERRYAAYRAEWGKRNRQKRVASSRKWQSKNSEQYRAYNKAWRKANPDKVKEHDRRKYQRQMADNPEKVRAYKREYMRKVRSGDRERFREAARRRYHANLHESRARILVKARRRKNLKGSHTVQQWLNRVQYYGWRCRWCNRPLTDKTITKDHVIPVVAGGSDWPANLAPACAQCNSGKAGRRSYTPPTTY